MTDIEIELTHELEMVKSTKQALINEVQKLVEEKENLINILIMVDREDMDANNDNVTDGTFFSSELHSKICATILPTLVMKTKELSKN